MSPAIEHDLSFDALNGGRPLVTTLAYWLGPCREFDVTPQELLAFTQVMSANYDVEEQTECDGRVCATFEPRWHRNFVPMAPVQLVWEWSPFPLACELLGEPVRWTCDAECKPHRSAVMFWDAKQITSTRVPGIEPAGTDAQRFVGILELAVRRAQQQVFGLVLGGSPGWCYESCLPIPEWIAESMRKNGYVLTDRRPRSSTRDASG